MNQRERDALDRHITGNYGEDQFRKQGKPVSPCWFWYVASNYELFIDCDRYAESIGHIRRRLQGAIECKVLDVKNLHNFKSSTENHRHIIIELHVPMQPMKRYAWEMLLHGDIYRAASNIMREEAKKVAKEISVDVLISKNILHRKEDAICFCKHKHTKTVMLKCQSAYILRGEFRATGYFGKPSNNPCAFLPYENTEK